ncbi:P-type HAD superfamily ATPase [Sulfuricella denitrificans skB26]|uniref:P-type HAD superfamily ATPase n=1 Tax=Sulfuricella denitrificans (strain DSM 22764 / NBRC 105220 / skB26) TaxID=1163617 RepID=S6AIM8_SULDS|nr:cation-transporting P-type ATPase [Sulfuricella denitrificans]BAN34384.1 P-type HAD superfamily ATPase [Sulfuricella denitrificans skB26]
MTKPTISLLEKHWHHLSSNEVAELLDSDLVHGLNDDEVRRRRESFGANLLTPKAGKSAWLRFLLQFHQPLIYILLAAASITAFLQEWVDSGVIFGVVLINAVIGFIQESRAEDAIAALARMAASATIALRDGIKQPLPAAELVPGDIVLLAPGDKVPADLRLFHARELMTDESALTGESLPVQKHTAHIEKDAVLADRTNMAYAGTLVTRGHGAGIVVATGDITETGRISRLIAHATDLSTPLTRKMKHFSAVMMVAILGLAAFTFVVGTWRGEPPVDMLMAAVALAVGAIPEGLPAAITITLAIGVSRMARRRAIIRKLPAVETLGGATVICSDKTGTLTENQMTVQEIHAGGEIFRVSGSGYAATGEISYNGERVETRGVLRECLLAGVLCNDAALVERDGRREVAGDPTEGALLVAAEKGGLALGEMHADYPRRDELPFDSRYQYMATLHEVRDGGQVIYVKGALEKILERAVAMLNAEGSEVALDPAKIETHAHAMASRGLRVLALAKGVAEEGQALKHSHLDRLVFIGLQGMIDPPRPEAIAAVKACHNAGIAVKMITGDHAVTAAAIAVHLGLRSQEGDPPLTGRQIAALSDDELRSAVLKTTVFARVEPEQKLRLVEALQAGGQIVAMTGDGVNDAPALKQADIGIAMGLSGTEVAKEAADMLLTDDNFASIEAAVEEGRGVFDNLIKFITWTLPTNFGEGLVILTAIVFGATLPITPLQILWINMTTAGVLGLMLAFEPIDKNIMQRPPRHPAAPILTTELMWRILLVSLMLLGGAYGLFLWELETGESLEQARTVAVNVFVMGELFYLFNCRSMTHSPFHVGFFSNPLLWFGVIGMIALQLFFTYASVMNHLFASAPIGLDDWVRIVAVGLIIYFVIEAEKAWRRRG